MLERVLWGTANFSMFLLLQKPMANCRCESVIGMIHNLWSYIIYVGVFFVGVTYAIWQISFSKLRSSHYKIYDDNHAHLFIFWLWSFSLNSFLEIVGKNFVDTVAPAFDLICMNVKFSITSGNRDFTLFWLTFLDFLKTLIFQTFLKYFNFQFNF